jgi:hypothetical protein
MAFYGQAWAFEMLAYGFCRELPGITTDQTQRIKSNHI